MLRTNLSTRPFYNERVVHVAVAIAALAVLGLTAFSVTGIVGLSRQNTELSGRTARDQAEADRLTKDAASIRRAIDNDELESVAAAALEANELIDQRTFSWTAFFNFIESNLPPDVMLVSVRPSVRNQQTRISMTVLSRRTEDTDEFVEKLEASGAFADVLPAQADPTEEGFQRAVLEGIYTGPGTESDAEAAKEGAAGTDPAKPDPAKPHTPKPDTAKPPAIKPPAGGRQ